jgi:hypothetical protein
MRNLATHLSAEHQSRVFSHAPLKLCCEFPKDYYVSLLLLSFAIALSAIAGELFFFIGYSMLHSVSIFSFGSAPYFLAYLLVNLLFAAHFLVYFCYREEIRVEGDEFHLTQKFLFLQKKWIFEREQLFFYQIKRNMLGSLYIELYYFNDSGLPKRLFFGSYLNEEHVILLSSHLRRLFFQAEFCPKE